MDRRGVYLLLTIVMGCCTWHGDVSTLPSWQPSSHSVLVCSSCYKEKGVPCHSCIGKRSGRFRCAAVTRAGVHAFLLLVPACPY